MKRVPIILFVIGLLSLMIFISTVRAEILIGPNGTFVSHGREYYQSQEPTYAPDDPAVDDQAVHEYNSSHTSSPATAPTIAIPEAPPQAQAEEIEDVEKEIKDNSKEAEFHELKVAFFKKIVNLKTFAITPRDEEKPMAINPFESIEVSWFGMGKRSATLKLSNGEELAIKVMTHKGKVKYFINKELNRKLQEEVEDMIREIYYSESLEPIVCDQREFNKDYVLNFSDGESGNIELIKQIFCESNSERLNKYFAPIKEEKDKLKSEVATAYAKLMEKTCYNEASNKRLEKILLNYNDIDTIVNLFKNPKFKSCVEKNP